MKHSQHIRWPFSRCLAFWILSNASVLAAEGITVDSPAFTANIRAGSIVALTAKDGTQYVSAPSEPRGLNQQRMRGEGGWVEDISIELEKQFKRG